MYICIYIYVYLFIFAHRLFYYFISLEIICPPIQHAFQLNITRPDRLTYGSRCLFSCDAGYPLIGPTEAYCDRTDDDEPSGYWDWGADMDSPYCEGCYI